MKTALDTNILSALWSGESTAIDVSQALGHAARQGALVISPIVFAELIGSPRTTEAFVRDYLSRRAITVEFQLPENTWAEAGRRFGQYAKRRRQAIGEEPKRLLADFVVGAHALLLADRLMTLDAKRYRQDFPELPLYPITV